jgi:hypothetical protein
MSIEVGVVSWLSQGWRPYEGFVVLRYLPMVKR